MSALLFHVHPVSVHSFCGGLLPFLDRLLVDGYDATAVRPRSGRGGVLVVVRMGEAV